MVDFNFFWFWFEETEKNWSSSASFCPDNVIHYPFLEQRTRATLAKAFDLPTYLEFPKVTNILLWFASKPYNSINNSDTTRSGILYYLCLEIRSLIPTTCSRAGLAVQRAEQRKSDGRGSWVRIPPYSDRVILCPWMGPFPFLGLMLAWGN